MMMLLFFYRKIRWSFLIFILILSACATPSRRSVQSFYCPSDYVELSEFCAHYNAVYTIGVPDDTITIISPNREIRVILQAPVAYFNGKIFTLKHSPYYLEGRIFLPRELETVLTSGIVPAFKPVYAIRTIVIDPGHGGRDPGAISRGIQEKVLTLKIARLIKTELEKRGYSIVLTRDKDIFLTLQQRVDLAKQNNADLFISIHANANRSKANNGMEIYYLHPSRLNSTERAKSLAKTDDMYSDAGSLAAKTILWDKALTENYALSVETGNVLFNNFKNLGFNVKPPRKAPFYVLRFAYVPAILFEIGYITNKYEAKALQKESYQQQIAEAVAIGVSNFSQRYAQLALADK